MSSKRSVRTVKRMITARNLTKQYGTTLAVDNLSFEVLPGRVTGFLGPNGAGKSTTMRMILGLDSPDHGSASVMGVAYRALEHPLRCVGAHLDARAFHGSRTAHNLLLALARSNRIPRRRVDEVIDLTGLGPAAHKKAGGFSLGMGQHLGIAAALLGDPEILLFDEPVNGLDPDGIIWIRTLLRSLADQGRTIFVSSHLMSEMALTADHLIVVGKGHLIDDTSVADFVGRSARVHVRVRSPQPAELAQKLAARGVTVDIDPDATIRVVGLNCAQVGDIAASADLTVHELYLHEPSLESAYMELTKDSVEYQAAALTA
jgi:ABC-2 type transport system ATP-binding protein